MYKFLNVTPDPTLSGLVILIVILIIYSIFMLYKFNKEDSSDSEKKNLEFTHSFIFGMFGIFPLILIIIGAYIFQGNLTSTFSSTISEIGNSVKKTLPIISSSAIPQILKLVSK
jgi:nitrogen fixation/metabolism regulation signal transduction histidine kinase